MKTADCEARQRKDILWWGKGKLITAEDTLFFILVYIKTYPTFDFLGFVFSCIDHERTEIPSSSLVV